MPEIKPECSTCAYYFSNRCRRYPVHTPIPFTDWCGEYEAKIFQPSVPVTDDTVRNMENANPPVTPTHSAISDIVRRIKFAHKCKNRHYDEDHNPAMCSKGHHPCDNAANCPIFPKEEPHAG